MRKRSEIKREIKRTCSEKLADGSICGVLLEKREDGHFCTVHGNRDPIVDLSKKLSDTLEESVKEETAKRVSDIRQNSGASALAWPSANRAKEKPIDERFARITETIFVDDVEATYESLEKQLRVGEDRSDRGVLFRALDNAESNGRLAHRLWMTAKLEQQRYEINNRIVFSAIRESALRTLQREKDQKLRSKQITEEDVELMSAQLHPDEYEDQMLRRKKAELMVKSMENLAEMWNKRCSALEVMCGKSR